MWQFVQRNLTRVALVMLAVVLSDMAAAAEIRLRAVCQPSSSLVTLADVAEIHANDNAEQEQLSGVQLFPAPVMGKSRFLAIRELQDLLRLRGVNLAQHVLSGASQTTVHSPVERVEVERVQPATPVERPLARHKRDRAVERLADAIIAYLNAQNESTAAWQVEIDVVDDHLRPLVEAHEESTLVVTGGQHPWTGSQRFTVQCETAAGSISLPVAATVTLPAMVLAATRTLQRGEIVQASDLQFQARRANDANIDALELVEEVVGRQVTRSIPAGAVLAAGDLREPVVVRRGDAVTVYSRAPGIRVRTTARAKQDGGLGDLIEVESFSDRSKFFARVSGVQEVEVFARGASLAPPMTAAATKTEPAHIKVDSDTAASANASVKAQAVGWRRAAEQRSRPAGE